VVEFGLGIWWRRFGVDVVAGLEVFLVKSTLQLAAILD